jgi:hypothetical protein
MRVKERLLKTEVVQAEYKGKGFQRNSIPTYYFMNMPLLTNRSTEKKPCHVFATKDGNVLNLKSKDIPKRLEEVLEEGKDYSIELKKFFGLKIRKKAVS